jgi:putative ABC transport system permease protein
MFRNLFKVAIRNIIRNKSYFIINLLGLSIGIACSILIMLFVLHELSYDKFNANYKRIYRLYLSGKLGASEFHGAWTCAPAAAAFVKDFPEVVDAVRLQNWGEVVIKFEDKSFLEKRFMIADSSFFNVFSIPLIQGNPATALAKPYSVVITKNIAYKYFGKEDPLDRAIRVNNDTTIYTITGVVDEVPENCHFEFDLLASFLTHPNANSDFWLSNNLSTYLLLEEGASPEKLQEKIPALLNKYAGPQLETVIGITMEEFLEVGNRYGYYLQPLSDIHLNPEIQHGFKPINDKKYIYIFSLVAFFIILLASINYMNLSTAQSASRSSEVGLRKVAGSTKALLIRQFLLESVLMTLLSSILALLIVEVVLPHFNDFIDLKLSMDYFSNWYFIPGLFLVTIIVGILAGSYPSFFLAAFKPVTVLSGKVKEGLRSGLLRRILVIVQFSISILIILGTIIIYRQTNYMLNKDLGFDKEHLLIIRRAEALGKEKIKVFRQEIEKFPGVVSSANSTAIPGHSNSNNGFLIEGESPDITILLWVNWIDFDYPETYKLKISKGRFHSEEYTTDTVAVVINESAVKKFGFDDPLALRLIMPGKKPEEQVYMDIVGVVKDYHFQSLHNDIEPSALLLKPEEWDWGGYLTIRISPDNIKNTISQIEEKWKEFTTNDPFQYFFLDKDYNNIYREERRTGKLSFGFALLAIFVACLGLFGLTSFAAEKKTKEIGIRKALGSSTGSIILLFINEILILVTISTLLAWPVAYYVMNKWLRNFHFRINLSVNDFLLPYLIAITVALLTVIYIAIMAARKNPVSALQYE